MTVEEVQQEILHLTIENIRHYPCTNTLREDFYSLANKFGITAARTIMIPPIFRGEIPRPTEVLNV